MGNGQPFNTKQFIAEKVWIFVWAVILGWVSLTFWGYTDLRAESKEQKEVNSQQIKEISNQLTEVDESARKEVKEAVEKLEKKIDAIDVSNDELKIKMAQNTEKINGIQTQQNEMMGILKDISKDVKKK